MHYHRNKVPYTTTPWNIVFHETNWYIRDYGGDKYLTITIANLKYKILMIKFEKILFYKINNNKYHYGKKSLQFRSYSGDDLPTGKTFITV